MHKKKLFLGVSIAALAVSVASFAAVVASKREMLVKATPQTDYQQTLTITANEISGNGSGSFTLNGNTFNYSGITVAGGYIEFNAACSLEFASESGATKSASGMVGGSFKAFAFQSVGACCVTYSFNGESGLVFEAADGEFFVQSINAPTFSFYINSGHFTTEAFHIQYDCVAPVQSHNVLVVGSSDVLDTTVTDSSSVVHTEWNCDSYVNIVTDLGGVATFTFQPIATHEIRILADATTQGGKRLRNALNDGVYDAVIIQIPRRMTPSATDVEAMELAALAQIKDLLHSETDNIYMMAPWCSANPTIFTTEGMTTKYLSTSTNENKTLAEMAAYYADIAEQMATIVDGKAMNLAQPFASYAGKHTFNTSSKHLLIGYVMYASFYNRIVPSACTYNAGASAKAVGFIREEVQAFCVHPEVL